MHAQISSTFCKVFQISDPTCAIFSKCRGLKDFKYDIPMCHEGHEGMRISLHICISLHFSSFLYISSNFMYLIAQDVPKRTKGTHMKFMKKLLYIGLHTFCFLLLNFRSDCAFVTPVVWLVTLLLSRR